MLRTPLIIMYTFTMAPTSYIPLKCDNFLCWEVLKQFQPFTFSDIPVHFETWKQRSHRNRTEIRSCPVCSRSMPIVFLKKHMSRFHGSQMPFSCKVCGKGFMSQSGMYHHKFTHEGRKFACPKCDHQFNQKTHLKTHLMRIHRLSQCQICNDTFEPGQEFDRHVLNCLLLVNSG